MDRTHRLWHHRLWHHRLWHRRVTRPAVLGVAVMVVLAAAGCGRSATGGSANATTPAAAPSTADFFAKVRSASLQDATFRQTFSVTGPSSDKVPSGTGQPEIDEPAHQFTATVTGQLVTAGSRVELHYPVTVQNTDTKTTTTSTVDMVSDPSGLFLRWAGADGWQSLPATADVPQFVRPLDVLTYDSLRDVTVVGSERVGDIQTWHLTGVWQPSLRQLAEQTTGKDDLTWTPGVGSDTKATEHLWVRQDNYLPVRITVKNETGDEGVQFSTDFTAWNSGVSIQVPTVDTVGGSAITAVSNVHTSGDPGRASAPFSAARAAVQPVPLPGSVTGARQPLSGCNGWYYGAFWWHWWGVHAFVSTCMIQDILAAASKLSFVTSLCAGPLCLFAAAYIAILVYWLKWDDAACGYRGAYLHVTWLAVAWVHKISNC
jgi:hypothetical protein